MTGPDIRVRRLDADGWRVVRTLRLAALRDEPRAFLGDPAAEEGRSETEWRGIAVRHRWLGAFVGEAPVGIAALVRDPETDDDYLESMWVEPGFRRIGVAEGLFREAGTIVRERGRDTLRLWVLDGNVTARTAYLRRGFAPTGRHQSIGGSRFEEEFSRVFPPGPPPSPSPSIESLDDAGHGPARVRQNGVVVQGTT